MCAIYASSILIPVTHPSQSHCSWVSCSTRAAHDVRDRGRSVRRGRLMRSDTTRLRRHGWWGVVAVTAPHAATHTRTRVRVRRLPSEVLTQVLNRERPWAVKRHTPRGFSKLVKVPVPNKASLENKHASFAQPLHYLHWDLLVTLTTPFFCETTSRALPTRYKAEEEEEGDVAQGQGRLGRDGGRAGARLRFRGVIDLLRTFQEGL